MAAHDGAARLRETAHGGIATLDGIQGNVFTRMNYTPAEFQNVKVEKTCEAPFVRIVALRDIAAGEELRVDHGPDYRCDVMQNTEGIRFFAGLGSPGPRRQP